jgi:hypothetical protein
MNTLRNISLFSAVSIASIVAQSAQAEVRDAAAKARGDYSYFAHESTYELAGPSRVYRAAVTPAVPQAAVPTQSRSFSYDATPAGRADAPALSTRPATGRRTFSYQPAAPGRRPATIGHAPAHSAADRNAASKVLGQY